MKSLRLILSLNLIVLGLILFTLTVPKTNKESNNKTTIKRAETINKTDKRTESGKPTNIPVIIPDRAIAPDTIETHYSRPQKKSEIRIFRRVINFHKRPFIT